MKHGYVRVGACTPHLSLANPKSNAETILKELLNADANEVSILCFPELSLTGYTCNDLFFQRELQQETLDSLFWLLDESKNIPILFAVGLPIAFDNKLYNCAALCLEGKLLGIVPKKNIPNYAEFYEARHFTAGEEIGTIRIRGNEYPFGTNLLFEAVNMDGLSIAAEICEDLWVPCPPSIAHAINGATVILNLSASDEIVTKSKYRRSLVSTHSAKLITAYIYADAGIGESTTDMVFAGHNLICENGKILAESPLFREGLLMQDIDIELLTQDRIRQSTYVKSTTNIETKSYTKIRFTLLSRDTITMRKENPYPFVPRENNEKEDRCEEILTLQAMGLVRRLSHTHCKHVVIGMSGGLDSTLAYLVTVRAFDILELPRTGIHAITMPCFGTTSRTHSNACDLAHFYETDFDEIPIQKAVEQHFADIKHDPNVFDVTYENAQARERTQILMDLANQFGGMVIGTGDLSELCIGFATYNGDHMSMYGVNASVPKTLVRDLVAHVAKNSSNEIRNVLEDILATPPSPELLPQKNDDMTQITEDLIGPYALHDFFLYYMLRYGFTPEKIFEMAYIAFDGEFDKATIKKWLGIFIRRFFNAQFKRSCLPDGPKVGSVTLSPRSDLRMPSDAYSKTWLDAIERITIE